MTVHLPVVYTVIHKAVTESEQKRQKEREMWGDWTLACPTECGTPVGAVQPGWAVLENHRQQLPRGGVPAPLPAPQPSGVPWCAAEQPGQHPVPLGPHWRCPHCHEGCPEHQWLWGTPLSCGSPWYNCNGWLGIKHQVTYRWVGVVLVGWWETDCKWQRIELVEKKFENEYCPRYGCCGWGFLLMEWSDKGVDRELSYLQNGMLISLLFFFSLLFKKSF